MPHVWSFQTLDPPVNWRTYPRKGTLEGIERRAGRIIEGTEEFVRDMDVDSTGLKMEFELRNNHGELIESN